MQDRTGLPGGMDTYHPLEAVPFLTGRAAVFQRPLSGNHISPVRESRNRLMLQVDLHVHSIFSLCGMHTHLELLREAKRLHMEAVAITDHGPALGGRINDVFFERFQNPVDGVQLLKGIECNLGKDRGGIDIPQRLVRYMDIVLLGIHPNTPRGCDSQTYTGLLCDAMRNNPFIDLIVHLDDPNYPVDFRQVADCAARLGMAVEINNSKTLHHRTSPERTVELITACMQAECSIAVTSDTHAITELGRDDAVLPYLQSCSVPAKQVITREKRSALDFLQSRKALKQQITHNIVGFFCMGM